MNEAYVELKSSPGPAVYRDFWNLSLFLFIIGLLTVSRISGLATIMILYGFILMAGFTIYLVFHRLLRLLPEVVVYMVWIIWALSGAAVAIDQALFTTKLMTVIQINFLLFLISSMVSLKRNVSVVMSAIIIGGVIVLLSSFYTGEFLEAGATDTRTRAAGLVENANGFAYHLTFVVYAVFYFWNRKSSTVWRIILLSILALSVLGIVYSGSRMGIIGLLAFLSLWWFFCARKKLPKHPITFYAMLLAILFASYQFINYILTKTYLGYRSQLILQESSSLKRLQFYKEGLDMIIHNFFFGVGLDNFRSLSPEGMYSHSNYIEIASTTGIVGFFIFFSIFVIVWRRLRRIEKTYKEPQCLYNIGLFKAAILTILLQSFATVNYSSKLTWVFLGAVIGFSWSLERTLSGLIAANKKHLLRLKQDAPHDLYRRDIL